MARDEEIKAWQDRLKETFSHEGMVGGRFLRVVRVQEFETGSAFVDKFHGHRVLTDSFLDFFGETLRHQSFLNNKMGWPEEPHYLVSLIMYLTVYRTIRAGEILSESGYPLRAYAIQRSVKEQLWILCGAAHGMATFDQIAGSTGKKGELTEADYREMFRARLKVEKAINAEICGKDSGLSDETQVQVLKWVRMFHKEVHRADFSFARALHRVLVEKKYDIVLGPLTDDLADGMYLNRSMELNWIALRLLPFVRRADTPANEHWAERWRILDESFRFMFDGFNALGKAIAPAYLELIETKFKFDPSIHFKEPKAKEPLNGAPAGN